MSVTNRDKHAEELAASFSNPEECVNVRGGRDRRLTSRGEKQIKSEDAQTQELCNADALWETGSR